MIVVLNSRAVSTDEMIAMVAASALKSMAVSVAPSSSGKVDVYPK